MIPVNEPKLGPRELEYVTECIQTGWISSAGRFIDQFEEQWAAYCGRHYRRGCVQRYCRLADSRRLPGLTAGG